MSTNKPSRHARYLSFGLVAVVISTYLITNFTDMPWYQAVLVVLVAVATVFGFSYIAVFVYRRRQSENWSYDDDEPEEQPPDAPPREPTSVPASDDMTETLTSIPIIRDDSPEVLRERIKELRVEITAVRQKISETRRKIEAKPPKYFMPFDPLYVYGYRAKIIGIGVLLTALVIGVNVSSTSWATSPALSSIQLWLFTWLPLIIMAIPGVYAWRWRAAVRELRPIELDPENNILYVHEKGLVRWLLRNSNRDPYKLSEVTIGTDKQSWVEQMFFKKSHTLRIRGKGEGSKDTVIRYVHDPELLNAIQAWYQSLQTLNTEMNAHQTELTALTAELQAIAAELELDSIAAIKRLEPAGGQAL